MTVVPVILPTLAAGFVTVIVIIDVPPTPMAAGVKVLTIVGTV